MAIKISYIPERGMITNYDDCEAIAPDGSRWKAASGVWHQLAKAAPKNPAPPRNPAAPMFGAFGFFVAMALFAKPVFMTFTDVPTGFGVLFAISCASAYGFYRITRY
jgi:hypothetical protein